MSIPIEKEPFDRPTLEQENCCFCYKETPFWNLENDVAICKRCASKKDIGDVPTKKEWCADIKERIKKGKIVI